MIFTLLYNNYHVIKRSLTKLRETNTLNLPIVAVDNDYPFLTKAHKTRLKNQFDLTIIGEVENRGLAGGYNELINAYSELDYAILYDCDSNPETIGWDEGLMDIIKSPDIAYASLMFDTAKREMKERGFTPIQVGKHVVWKPKQACVQSVSVADLNYLRSIGGMQEPKKYYGGLESTMFKYWNDQHKLVYLDGYYETQLNQDDDVDEVYIKYKWDYAHKRYNGTFEDFIESQETVCLANGKTFQNGFVPKGERISAMGY